MRKFTNMDLTMEETLQIKKQREEKESNVVSSLIEIVKSAYPVGMDANNINHICDQLRDQLIKKMEVRW